MKSTKNSLFPYYTKINLSDREEWREYTFPGGDVVHIDNPQFLIVSDNGHRIGCGEYSEYIPYGWIRLRWKNKEGRKDNFYCENSEEWEMDENTKWIAEVFQKYSIEELAKDGSFKIVIAATQVVALSVKAGSAFEAADKANAWIEKSGVKDTYVGKVCRDGIKEVEE